MFFLLLIIHQLATQFLKESPHSQQKINWLISARNKSVTFPCTIKTIARGISYEKISAFEIWDFSKKTFKIMFTKEVLLQHIKVEYKIKIFTNITMSLRII